MSAQEYFLSDHVYACTAQAQVVILDVRNDRYLALPPEAASLLSQLPIVCRYAARDISNKKLQALLQELLEQGILTTDAKRGKLLTRPAVPPPTNSLLQHRADFDGRTRAVDFGALLFSAIYANIALRALSFERIVVAAGERRRSKESTTHNFDMDLAHHRVRTFLRFFVPLFGTHNKCLFESLSLLHFLSRDGLFPHWVFGVCARPFAAHCWLQFEDTVLNDTVDHVLNYTPIMAV